MKYDTARVNKDTRELHFALPLDINKHSKINTISVCYSKYCSCRKGNFKLIARGNQVLVEVNRSDSL